MFQSHSRVNQRNFIMNHLAIKNSTERHWFNWMSKMATTCFGKQYLKNQRWPSDLTDLELQDGCQKIDRGCWVLSLKFRSQYKCLQAAWFTQRKTHLHRLCCTTHWHRMDKNEKQTVFLAVTSRVQLCTYCISFPSLRHGLSDDAFGLLDPVFWRIISLSWPDFRSYRSWCTAAHRALISHYERKPGQVLCTNAGENEGLWGVSAPSIMAIHLAAMDWYYETMIMYHCPPSHHPANLIQLLLH